MGDTSLACDAVIGVEPASLETRLGLSATVAGSLETLTRRVAEEISGDQPAQWRALNRAVSTEEGDYL